MTTPLALPAAIERMTAGAHLHMEFGEEGRRWWLENPFAELEPAVGQALRDQLTLVPLGDTLFGEPGGSQSWRLGVECGHCGGSGHTVEAVCCMQPRRSGECCSNPVPQQVECGECGGGGLAG